MKRPYGMALPAFQAFIRACTEAGISPTRVTQTIGNAPASAGFHAPDGVLNSERYCAAVDLHTRDLNRTQIKKLLNAMAKQGFAAWYRFEGSFANNQHLHAVYAALPMKRQLRAQVVDFLNDRTGLAGHAHETFYTAPRDIDIVIQAMFLHANPVAGKALATTS